MSVRTRVGLGVLLLLAACDAGAKPAAPQAPALPGTPAVDGGQSQPSQPPVDGADGAVPFATSKRETMLWKRHAALEADLMSALELERDDVCKELGERSCIRDIHVIALGGNDPFRSGINVPPSQPLSTTSTVIDRVLLSACSARARADKAGPAKVFTELSLAGPAPAPDAPAVQATITSLFRRLLARDPTASEVAILQTLLDPGEADAPQSAEEFAVLACFAIGSSLEFLFQ